MNNPFNPNFPSSDLNEEYQRLLEEISLSVAQKFPNSVQNIKDGVIELRRLEEIEEMMNPSSPSAQSQGRGGNNVAENMKKSIRSLFKKYLSTEIYQEFDERYVKHYGLKSQKENYVLFFLFLHELRC